MALTTGELFSSSDGARGPFRVVPTKIVPKQVAATAIVLAKLTPMGYQTATNEWAPWDADGANDLDTIRGFLMEEAPINTDSQILQIMLAGTIHYDDIVDAIESNGVETAVDLATELRSAVQRAQGIFIEGLTQVK